MTDYIVIKIIKELSDPLNRNESRPNLPKSELLALKQLIDLQNKRIITIKPCDKGAGLIILNFDEYLASCHNHLGAKQQQEDGSFKNYYSEVNEFDLKAARDQVSDVVNTAYNDGLLSKDEYNAMNPDNCGPGKFYELFKVHKSHVEGKAPPERPIVSACGSITENIGKFAQTHLKKFSNIHQSYLQDSPDFLRSIEDQNNSDDIEDDDILVT